MESMELSNLPTLTLYYQREQVDSANPHRNPWRRENLLNSYMPDEQSSTPWKWDRDKSEGSKEKLNRAAHSQGWKQLGLNCLVAIELTISATEEVEIISGDYFAIKVMWVVSGETCLLQQHLSIWGWTSTTGGRGEKGRKQIVKRY